MTKPDTDKLRQLANAATPGPWKPTAGYEASQAGRYDDDVSILEDAGGEPVIEHVYYDGHHTIMRPRDVAYVAACSPDVMLELLDRLAEAQAEREALRAQLIVTEEGSYSDAIHMRDVNSDLRSQLAAAKEECERLRERNELLSNLAVQDSTARDSIRTELAAVEAQLEQSRRGVTAYRDAYLAYQDWGLRLAPMAMRDEEKRQAISEQLTTLTTSLDAMREALIAGHDALAELRSGHWQIAYVKERVDRVLAAMRAVLEPAQLRKVGERE